MINVEKKNIVFTYILEIIMKNGAIGALISMNKKQKRKNSMKNLYTKIKGVINELNNGKLSQTDEERIESATELLEKMANEVNKGKNNG